MIIVAILSLNPFIPDTLEPTKRAGAEFLVESMSPNLLEAVGPGLFLRNLELAYGARQEFPWAMDLPEDIFFHYVLPPVVSQEPPENWREMFLDSLRPVVKGLKDPAEVALAVNAWCGQRVKYKPTQRRDQGPLETWRSGFGRCEEMTIFYISALRSVGIPARQAYTPRWPFTESNHAWTEVYVNGTWRYAGSCEPAESLNCAWFSGPVKRAAVVFSVAPGFVDTGEIYRRGSDYILINSTGNYRDVCHLVVEGAQPGDTMGISVLNYGAFRLVAVLVADEKGRARCLVGPGDYLLTGPGFSQIISPRGEGTTIRVRPGSRVPEGFWLRYPEAKK